MRERGLEWDPTQMARFWAQVDGYVKYARTDNDGGFIFDAPLGRRDQYYGTWRGRPRIKLGVLNSRVPFLELSVFFRILLCGATSLCFRLFCPLDLDNSASSVEQILKIPKPTLDANKLIGLGCGRDFT